VIFVAAILTPKLTPASAPVLTQIPIVAGTITRLLVWFPPGQNGLAHIKLLYGLQQLFPSNEQADFAGGDVLIEWDEDIVIDTPPLLLTAVTYNQDDTYDHTITVHVVMQPATGQQTANQVIQQVFASQAGG